MYGFVVVVWVSVICSEVYGVMNFIIIFSVFKQNTAYELRISDLSSDVCSSDLIAVLVFQQHGLDHAVFGDSRGMGGGAHGHRRCMLEDVVGNVMSLQVILQTGCDGHGALPSADA